MADKDSKHQAPVQVEVKLIKRPAPLPPQVTVGSFDRTLNIDAKKWDEDEWNVLWPQSADKGIINSWITMNRECGIGIVGKYLDNPAYEARLHFEKTIALAARLWMENFGAAVFVQAKEFASALWEFCRGRPGKARHMCEGDVALLTSLYMQDKLGTLQFCHCLLHLNREEIEYEAHEVSLSETIRLVHDTLVDHKAKEAFVTILSPGNALNILSSKDTPKKWLLCLNEGRRTVLQQRLTTAGLNLMVCTLDIKGQIIYLPLISALPDYSTKSAYFLDRKDGQQFNLDFVPALVEDLRAGRLQTATWPLCHLMKRYPLGYQEPVNMSCQGKSTTEAECLCESTTVMESVEE